MGVAGVAGVAGVPQVEFPLLKLLPKKIRIRQMNLQMNFRCPLLDIVGLKQLKKCIVMPQPLPKKQMQSPWLVDCLMVHLT